MKIAEFEIEVERKAIKNIHLAVYPPDGRVHISVPEHMRDDDVSMFLYSKLPWIRKQHESVMTQERQPDREFVSGENHYLFGNRYLLQVIPTRDKAHVVKTAKVLEMHVRPQSTLEHKQTVMDEFYREELKAVLTQQLEKWTPIVEETINSFTWQVLRMTRKWGSCATESRKIQFNLLLARVPLRCIEYVVVHELCHLKVHRHDKVFISLLTNFMPDWQMRKRELDEFISLPIKES